MNPIKMPGLTATIGEDQGFEPLPVRVDKETHTGFGDVMVLTTYWQPDAYEFEQIAAGKPIVIRIWAKQHPPITVTTHDTGLT